MSRLCRRSASTLGLRWNPNFAPSQMTARLSNLGGCQSEQMEIEVLFQLVYLTAKIVCIHLWTELQHF